ncbi:MAG: hypothetical protein J6C97_00395, partial [Clostridia bacterium]|nr:hypothetical protein [Clostridia bacterium]
MKAKLQKVSYYVILALLAICFVFTGASLIVTADDNSSSNTQTIKYVSLGDSMTNGYGLNGYANNGLMIETPSAYPARFAKYLSQVKNAEVDLVQLAVAAQRPEDISFFLEIDLNDQEAVDIANRTKNEWIAKYGDTEWKNGLINEWNAKFKNGDFYTWTEQTDGRLKGFPEGATERERLVNALRTYQESVRDADVISLCEGNANFGVFLLNKLLTVLGGGTSFFNSDWEWVNIQDAVRSLDAETQSLILSLNDELTTLLAEQMPDNPQLVKDVTKLLSYTVTSYVISYKNLLDQIVTYNPDVEIMVVGIINSFYGTKIAYEQDGQKQILDIGEIFELIFGTLNYYQTSVPTIMQLSGNPLYKDVKFLYAEPTQDVELLVTQLSRSYDLTTKTWKDVDDVDSLTLRDRNTRQFNHNIFGLIKGLINPLISDYGLQLEEINLQDVLAYEQFIAKWQAHLQDETNPEPKPTDVYTVKKLVGTTYQDVQTTLSLNKIITASIFLAIDDVSVYASTLTELDASAFLSIATGGLNDGLFSGVASALDPNALIDMNAISADVQNAVLSDEATYTAVKQYIISTYDDLIRPQVEQWVYEFYVANGTMPTAEQQEQYYLGIALSNNDIVNDVMFNPNYGLKFVQQYLSYYLANNIYSPLNQALKQDATLVGLFSLYSRFMVGDGLGVHPSKYGHDTILNSIISSYENGYTCKDAVIDKTLMVVDSVATVIKEHGNEILNSAYDYLDTNGYIDQFNGYVAQAEQMLQELQLSLNQTIDSYVTLAKEQVDLALKDIKAQIETIKPMAEKLGGDIEKKVNEIIAFVDKLENDIINGINSVLTQAEDISLAIKEYSSLVSTRLQNFVVMVEEKVAIVSEQIALEIHNLSANLQVKINDAITYSKNLIANATSQDTINKIKADLDKFLTDAKQDFYLAVTNLVNDYKQELATFVEQVKQEQIKFIKETVLIIKTSVSNIVAEISSEISLAVKDFAYTLTQDAKAFVLEISNSVEKEIANLYKTFVDRLVNVIGTSEEAILTATEYVLGQLESIYTFADSVIGNLDGVLQEIATTLCNQISYIAYNVNLQVATTINTLYNNIKPMVLASVDKIATSLEQVDFAQIKQDLLSLVTSVELELKQSLQTLFDNYSAKLAEFIQVVQQEQIAIVSQALQSVKVFAEQAFAEITTLLGNEIKVVLEQIGLQLTSCLVLVKNLALDTANSCYNSILANLSNLKDFKQDLLNTITSIQANLTVELQNLYAKYTALYQDILSSIQQTQNELFIFVFTQIKQTGEYILTELQTT